MANELKDRLQQLVNEAGGRPAFAKKVWWKDKSDAYSLNKAKLSNWLAGNSEMSSGEAKTIAARFGRRVGWLLFGELPERPYVALADADLDHEVARHVFRELSKRMNGDQKPPRYWASYLDSVRVDGKAVLSLAVEREYERFRDAVDSLDKFVDAAGEELEKHLWSSGLAGPDKRQRSEMLQRLRLVYIGAEFKRRIREPGSALRYIETEGARTEAEEEQKKRLLHRRTK